MNRKTRIVTLLTLFVLALFIIVPAASAFDGRSGERVVVGKDEVINDDLFVGGNTVTVDGTINGDLIAMGRTVVVNGKVTGNVISAGAGVTINGEVGHDVMAAGAAVTLGPNARIRHSAYTAGGSVESQSGSLVDGSLLIGAGQGLVSGQTTTDLFAGGGRLRLEGSVGRNAKLRVATAKRAFSPASVYDADMPRMPYVPAGLTFGPEAHVAGSLEYVSAETAQGAAAVSSQVVHTLPPQDQQLSREVAQRQTASSYLFDAIRRLVALLFVGLLIAWLAPRWITGPAAKLLSQPLPSLALGLAGLIVAPITWLVALGVLIAIAVVFGLLSLGALTGLTLLAGLPVLGLAFVAILFVVSYLCQVIIAYVGGRWILSRTRPEWNRRIFAPLLIGMLILGVLFAVPVAGVLLQVLTVLAGLGAVILAVLPHGRAPEAPAEIPAVVEA